MMVSLCGPDQLSLECGARSQLRPGPSSVVNTLTCPHQHTACKSTKIVSNHTDHQPPPCCDIVARKLLTWVKERADWSLRFLMIWSPPQSSQTQRYRSGTKASSKTVPMDSYLLRSSGKFMETSSPMETHPNLLNMSSEHLILMEVICTSNSHSFLIWFCWRWNNWLQRVSRGSQCYISW